MGLPRRAASRCSRARARSSLNRRAQGKRRDVCMGDRTGPGGSSSWQVAAGSLSATCRQLEASLPAASGNLPAESLNRYRFRLFPEPSKRQCSERFGKKSEPVAVQTFCRQLAGSCRQVARSCRQAYGKLRQACYCLPGTCRPGFGSIQNCPGKMVQGGGTRTSLPRRGGACLENAPSSSSCGTKWRPMFGSTWT